MQQCPSPFHTSDDPRPTCNRRLLCPWCWCRDTTSDLYKRIDSAVYMHNQKRAIPMNLLAIRANEVLEEPEDYAAVFKMVADEGKKYRRRLNRRAIGAHFNVVLEPLGSGAIRVEHRVLLCLPPDTTHPNLDDVFADEIHHIKSSRKAPLNREKISDLVGWVTRYPAGLLLADAETLSEIGTARKYSRYRLKANLGVLRDSAMRRLLRCHRQ
jgi:hypothetical protein